MGLRGPHGAKGERGPAGKDGTPGLSGQHGRPAEKGEKGKLTQPSNFMIQCALYLCLGNAFPELRAL